MWDKNIIEYKVLRIPSCLLLIGNFLFPSDRFLAPPPARAPPL